MAARRLRTDMEATVVATGRYEWSIPSSIHQIDRVVSELTGICSSSGFTPKQCRLNIPVAVTEAMSNAVINGNAGDPRRKVKVTARIDSSALMVDVMDEGVGFDEQKVRVSPDDPDWLERENGRGLFLMRALMDDVQCVCVSPPAGGHMVRMVLRRT